MPLYIADYLSATEHLDAAHSGAYLHLIMHYWQKGNLPQEDKFLARIARMTDRQWKTAKPVLQSFFADGWRHERIDSELDKAQEKAEARAECGRRGGKAKALKEKEEQLGKATISPQQKPSKNVANGLASSSESRIEIAGAISKPSAQKPTPRSVLLECLSSEIADAVIEHRQKKRAPLTVLAAIELVKGFKSTADPDDAARTMVARGWQGFKPDWYENDRAGGNGRSNGQRRSLVEAGRELIRDLEERENGRQDSPGARDDALRLLSSLRGE